MQKFNITTNHHVVIDSFTEGEGDSVNYFDVRGTITAKNLKEAIKEYFETILHYSFNPEHAQLVDGALHYSNLVDEENSEVKQGSEDFEQWKKGNKVLYTDRTIITAEKVEPLDMESFNN